MRARVAVAAALALVAFEAAARPAVATRELAACVSYDGWQAVARGPKAGKPPQACAKRIPKGDVVEIMDPDAGEGSATVQWRGKAWYVDADPLGH